MHLRIPKPKRAEQAQLQLRAPKSRRTVFSSLPGAEQQHAEVQQQQQQQQLDCFPLLDLPNDMLVSVLTAAAASSDNACRATCRQLSGIMDSHVSGLSLRGYFLGFNIDHGDPEYPPDGTYKQWRGVLPRDLDQLSHIVTRSTGLRSLNLKFMTAPELAAALPDAVQRRLKALRLNECDMRGFSPVHTGQGPAAPAEEHGVPVPALPRLLPTHSLPWVVQRQLQALHIGERSGPEPPLVSLAGCTALRELAVDECRDLQHLLPQLAALTGLRSLRLCNITEATDRLTFAAALAPLVRLTQLHVQCGKVLYNGQQLQVTTDALCHLTSLRELTLILWDAADVAPLAALSSLERLEISDAGMMGDLSPLSHLTALTSLALRAPGDRRFHDLPVVHPDVSTIRQLTSLIELTLAADPGCLFGCGKLALLTALHFTALHPFALTDAHVEAVGQLTRLRLLHLHACDGVSTLEPLAALQQLQRLNLLGCGLLRGLEPLSALTKLTELELGSIPAVTSLQPLSGLTRLERLACRSLSHGALSDIRLAHLHPLTRLQHLDLSDCTGMHCVDDLAGMTGLRELHLDGWQMLTDLSHLSTLPQLRELQLAACEQLADLAPLASLQQLQVLRLRGCRQVSDLAPLSRLARLEVLDISLCRVTSLQPLSRLVQLRELDADRCYGFPSLEPLRGLIKLQQLLLEECVFGGGIEPLRGLQQLRVLNLARAVGIEDLEPLIGLPRLWHLEVRNIEEDHIQDQGRRITQLRRYIVDYD